MIKNLNDIVSLIVLLALIIFSIRIFIWTFVAENNEELKGVSRLQLLKEYNDNVEE